jgi:CheY-like chemotaxis protein
MTHVLVVDGDAAMRAMLRDVLEEEAYHVTTAPNGPAALAHLWVSDRPLVVLLEARLPGLTGTQVIDTYLAGAQTNRREFIILTASPETVLDTSLNGRVPVLVKPFNLDTLLEAVAQAFARLEARDVVAAGHKAS